MTVERRRDNPPKDFSVFGERASLTLGLITALTGIVMSITAAWMLLNHSQEFQAAERHLSQQSDISQVEPEPKRSFKDKRREASAPSDQKPNLNTATQEDASVETTDQNLPEQQPKVDFHAAESPARERANVQSLADDDNSDVARSMAGDSAHIADRQSETISIVIQPPKDNAAGSGAAAQLQQTPREEPPVPNTVDAGIATDQTVGKVPGGCAPLFSATFTSNKARPIAENLSAKAKALALWLKDNPQATVIVEGHTDVWGEASYNLALSERRADSVVKLLVAAGAPSDDRLLAQGLGEEAALRRGGLDSDKDRRVSMRVEGGTPCNQTFANGELDR